MLRFGRVQPGNFDLKLVDWRLLESLFFFVN